MTKLLKPIGMDIYIFRMRGHKSILESIGIGEYYNGEIDDQVNGFIIMHDLLFWKVDFLIY